MFARQATGTQSLVAILLLIAGFGEAELSTASAQEQPAAPASVLRLNGQETDPATIDYPRLPVIKGTHAVICPTDPEWKFQLHNYLLFHEGRFWCMWSHGPSEDTPPQHIRYATSPDGLKWSEPRVLARPPREGYGYIARGFWVRDGELLALIAHYKGQGAFGVNKELKLEAHAWDRDSESWTLKSVLYEDAINSFPPGKLSTGEWMLTRRDSRFNTSMLIGGVASLTDWTSFPIVKSQEIKGFRPDEPHWYETSDGKLRALIRDNGGSSRLYLTTSHDNARTWTKPVLTNFPNATSKFYSIKTSKGYRALAINANPKIGRRELYLALSEDGIHYPALGRLDIPSARPSTLQYPHVMEHDGQVYIVFSRNKTMSEVFVVSLNDLEPLRNRKTSEKTAN